ncbi:MAG: DUF1835 domain-containing protein [Pseudomonadota bacterium]
MTSTLHIRCGSDIRDGLGQAGVPGDFLEFSDPVCKGGTPAGDDDAFHAARLDYLTVELGVSRAQTDTGLREALNSLEQTRDYERVVLWFEHDIYDQAVLIRLLSWFADRPELEPRLNMISIDRFPGIDRFIGLGQLEPDQLKTLWGSERPVTPAQITLGRRAWQAFRAPEPLALFELAAAGTPDLPFLAPALMRHLRELPWTTDGLSLTERLTLRAIAEGAETPGQCFRDLHGHLEPQPFLGDIMYWPIVTGLARAKVGALTEPETWKSPIALTSLGNDLLDGKTDWVETNGIDRWVGGVHVRPGNLWRWDPSGSRPVKASA